MKLKYQISLFVIIALLVVNSSLATSYSLWTITRNQTGQNLITSGCFEISYDDSDSINLQNEYPRADAIGKGLRPYRVTIVNTCSIDASYKFVISDLNSNTLASDNIRYYLTKNDGGEFGPQAFNTLEPYTLDSAFKTGIESEKGVSIKNSYLMATGILRPNDTATYELRLWVKEDASGTEIMEKEFGAVVSFEAVAVKAQS